MFLLTEHVQQNTAPRTRWKANWKGTGSSCKCWQGFLLSMYVCLSAGHFDRLQRLPLLRAVLHRRRHGLHLGWGQSIYQVVNTVTILTQTTNGWYISIRVTNQRISFKQTQPVVRLMEWAMWLQNCWINAIAAVLGGTPGYVTAQGREIRESSSGCIFSGGSVVGSGSAYLGRAYRKYPRVVFKETYFWNITVPEGWCSWDYTGQE